MSDRRRDEDGLDDILRQWLGEVAPASAPGQILDDVRRSALTMSQQSPRRGWYSILAGAAAAALVAIFFFGGTRDVGLDEAAPTPTSRPSTLAPTATAAGTSATPGTSREPWDRAEVELPADNSSRIHAASAGVHGYVAVGGGGSVEGLGGVLAWHSIDGRSWDLTLDAHARQDGSQMLDVVATDEGYVAVGYNVPGTPVWVSVDGLSWREADDSSAPDGSIHSLDALAAGEAGLIAIGFTSESDAQIATAWSSNDGSAWTRLDVPDAFASAWPVDIAIADDGTGIIVGMTLPGQGDPVAWLMREGIIGEPITLPSEDPDASVAAVVDAGRGFMAIGHGWDPAESAYRLLAWRSIDGRSWETVQAEVIGLPLGAAWIEARGLVAVGATMGLEESEVRAWQLLAGGAWRALAVETSNGAGQAVLERPDGRLLIVGSSDPDGEAVIWIEP